MHEAKITDAFISSRLDNGNSLLYGIPDYLIERLQHMHNTAARILTQTHKYDHITPVLKGLHWMAVKTKIVLKVLTLTFHCLKGLALTYLSRLLQSYLSTQSESASSLSY